MMGHGDAEVYGSNRLAAAVVMACTGRLNRDVIIVFYQFSSEYY